MSKNAAAVTRALHNAADAAGDCVDGASAAATLRFFGTGSNI